VTSGVTYYIEVVQYSQAVTSASAIKSLDVPSHIDEVVLNAKFTQTTPLGIDKYDDINGSWIYSDNWATFNAAGPYNNTLHYSTALNSSALVAFEGARFKLTYTGYGNRGQVSVIVDNVNVGTINQYNSSLAWQQTWISPTFTHSIHTLKLVHATGAFVDIDAIEVLPVPPLGPGKYDDTQTDWVYSGNWATYAISGPYKNTLHYSTDVDDHAVLVFRGIQFILTYTGNVNRGQATVLVDGNPEGTINQYNSSLAWQQTWTSPTFTNGVHTLQLTHEAGDIFDVDAIQIIGPLPPGKYDDTHISPYYNGNWATYTSSGPYNNTLHYSNIVNEDIALQFEGTQFILTYTGNVNRGQMTVLVDGNPEGTINQYNSSLAWQQTWTSPTFTNGVHTLQLTHASGAFVDIDAIQIIGPLPPGKYDDTNTSWNYTGNWATYTGSGSYNNTLHYSSTLNDDATVQIEGTQFILTYTGYVNRGQVTVLVDGNPAGTIDQYNPSLAWQKTWTSPTFTYDVHTLQLINAGGAVVDIDAIQVIVP
jgi:hypothetical protein